MAEQFIWQAETTDNHLLIEDSIPFGEVMKLNYAGDIKYFGLYQGIIPKFVVKLGGKRKLIFFRRRMNHVNSQGTASWTITCIGWEERISGKSIKTLLYIYPNGNVELNNDEPTLAMAYHQKVIDQLQESNP